MIAKLYDIISREFDFLRGSDLLLYLDRVVNAGQMFVMINGQRKILALFDYWLLPSVENVPKGNEIPFSITNGTHAHINCVWIDRSLRNLHAPLHFTRWLRRKHPEVVSISGFNANHNDKSFFCKLRVLQCQRI